MTPTTEPAQRIAIMFKRRLTTPWSEKEIKQYKVLVKSGILKLDDIDLLERYYAFERRKEDKGVHRRDLGTFLNNYTGELDRARVWDEDHRFQCRQVLRRVNNGELPVSDKEFERIRNEVRIQLEQFRKKMAPPCLEIIVWQPSYLITS